MGFTALPLASGDTRGAAYGVSADGHTIVGITGTSRACYWTDGAGPTVIGGVATDAFGVSADGSIIAGNRSGGGGYRWTSAGGVVPFGVSADGIFAMSSDGSTVVGSTGSPEQACFWNAAGTRTLLGYLPGDDTSRAMAASSDGSVIVGFSYLRSVGTMHAFRWTSAGMVNLGLVGTSTGARAFGVSANGSVVVGGLDSDAFRWTSAGGMVEIAGMEIATAISGDGNTIIGSCPMPGEGSSYFGYWTASGGIVVPDSNPADPGDANGTYPYAVSADGQTVAGYSFGASPLPWLFAVTAPPPSLTEMLCFHASGDAACDNLSLLSPPIAQHAFSFVGDFILTSEGAFAFGGDGTVHFTALSIGIGWISGGGPTGSGPDYGITLSAYWSGSGSNFMTAFFGPLTTPVGTQFHVELDFDTQAGSCNAYENGVALARYSFFPGSPHFNLDTLTDLSLTYTATSGDGCAGNVGFYVGTTTPTGTPYVYLTIPPGGTADDFLSNSTGTAGPFTMLGAHLCSYCYGIIPPPSGGAPKLWLLRHPEHWFIGA